VVALCDLKPRSYSIQTSRREGKNSRWIYRDRDRDGEE
jgi:hypothetical protein